MKFRYTQWIRRNKSKEKFTFLEHLFYSFFLLNIFIFMISSTMLFFSNITVFNIFFFIISYILVLWVKKMTPFLNKETDKES